MLCSNPIAGMIVGDLTDERQATVRQILDGLLRDRSEGKSPAVLTAPLNIASGPREALLGRRLRRPRECGGTARVCPSA